MRGSREIQSLEGLERAENLEHLDLSYNRIRDISQLANLRKLKSLDLSRNLIEDISALTRIPDLNVVDLSGNRITDLSVLRESQRFFAYLYLADNQISNLHGLADLRFFTMPGGITVDLSNNPIEDITPLLRWVEDREQARGAKLEAVPKT